MNKTSPKSSIQKEKIKTNIAPKSSLGKWSIVLIVMTPILFSVGMSSVGLYEGVIADSTIFNDIIARPLLALLMLGSFVCGISAFFIGIFGILKKKDYSV
jgi:hypothetical protein